MTNLTNYFNCKLIPLDNENLGVIFTDGRTEARLVCRSASARNFSSLINALYYLHRDVIEFDNSGTVEYIPVDDEGNIIEVKLYTRATLHSAPEDAIFFAKRAVVIWDMATDEDVGIGILKVNEKIRNTPLHIRIKTRCDEPQECEFYVTYKNLCVAVIKAYESFIAEFGVEKYNTISGNSPVNEEQLKFLKAYALNK